MFQKMIRDINKIHIVAKLIHPSLCAVSKIYRVGEVG